MEWLSVRPLLVNSRRSNFEAAFGRPLNSYQSHEARYLLSPFFYTSVRAYRRAGNSPAAADHGADEVIEPD
jgi:hypothetical protein